MKFVKIPASGEYVLYDENIISEAFAKKTVASMSQFSGSMFPHGFLLDETSLMYTELSPKVDRKNQSASFVNEASDNSAFKTEVANLQIADSSKVYAAADIIIGNDEVSKGFKAIGGKIIRQTFAYDVEFDANGHATYVAPDGSKSNSMVRGTYTAQNKTVMMCDIVGKFNKSDMDVINKVKAEYDTLKANGVSDIKSVLKTKFRHNEFNMFDVYLSNFSSEIQVVNGAKTTVFHEIKHAETADYVKSFRLSPKSKPLSLENQTRLMEDDEKSAVIASAFRTIETYFKNGEDINIFDNYTTGENLFKIVSDIKNNAIASGASEAEAKAKIKEYLTDYAKVAVDVADYWDRDIAKSYKGIGSKNQFESNLHDWVQHSPTHKIGDDASTDNEEYIRLRKLMYQYKIYDPESGGYKNINFAKVVKDAEISAEFMDKVVKPCKQVVDNRRSKLSPELVAIAKLANQDAWDNAVNDNDVYDNVINVDTLDKDAPLPPDPYADNLYKETLRTYYNKVATDNGYKYVEDSTSLIYEASLEKADGSKTYVEANNEKNIHLGASDSAGKEAIPDYQDFLDMANYAKERGAPIAFGDIKDAEFKARLMAACLEVGVDMQNPPKKEELANISNAVKVKILRHAVNDKTKFAEITNTPERNEVDNARQELRDSRKTGAPEPATARDIIEKRQREMAGR